MARGQPNNNVWADVSNAWNFEKLRGVRQFKIFQFEESKTRLGTHVFKPGSSAPGLNSPASFVN
jgi:hypothetical protein